MLVVLVLGILLVFSTVDPIFSKPQQDQSLACGFGYEILATRLDQLELKLQNTLDEIVSSVNLKQQHSRYDRLSIGSCDEATATKNHLLRLPNHPTPIEVYCDMDVQHGGWLVIQQRLDGSVDFNRSWSEYRWGFGVVGQSSEFWLGLETIHQLTKVSDHELLVELKNEYGQYGYARYGRFSIGDKDTNFKINSVGEFQGTIDNVLSSVKFATFSTYGEFLSVLRNKDCAQKYGFGSWFLSPQCGGMFLNGPYKKNLETGYGIRWGEWTHAATYSRMLIRRK